MTDDELKPDNASHPANEDCGDMPAPEICDMLVKFALACEMLTDLSTALTKSSETMTTMLHDQHSQLDGTAIRRLPVMASNLGSVVATLERQVMRFSHKYEDANTCQS